MHDSTKPPAQLANLYRERVGDSPEKIAQAFWWWATMGDGARLLGTRDTPRLLDALKDVVTLARVHGAAADDPLILKARAAIAKAEGRS